MEVEWATQEYLWGCRGSESVVARLRESCSGGQWRAASEQTYAELWLGTHASGPTRCKDGTLLSNVTGELPFLLKILSVNQALSIQAHPDQALARRLHAERPDIYRDPHHKPEMAIALTPFELLCGFRTAQAVVDYVQRVPELRSALGDADCCQRFAAGAIDDKTLLRDAFAALMDADAAHAAQQVAALVLRIQQGNSGLGQQLDELIVRLAGQYPGDRGPLCVFLLNVFVLQPGEAVFLGAGVPHAYLRGDCVECMACSDNVARAALTPKLRDVPTLLSMLRFEQAAPLPAQTLSPGVVSYVAPVPEFRVDHWFTGAKPEPLPSHALLVVLSASAGAKLNGIELRAGCAIYLAPKTAVQLEGEFDIYVGTENADYQQRQVN